MKSEGFSATPYKDSLGHLTIGYGLNLESGLTKDEAFLIMRQRLQTVREQVAYAIPCFTRLSARRQDVLVEMAYNMGLGKLLRFRKMLDALEREQYPRAAREMLDSVWASQVKGRAERLAEVMVKG